MIYFALPVYNERENLEPLLDNIESVMKRLDKPYGVVAVDDGSNDGTAERLKDYATRLPLHVLTHSQNMNLGPTIRDAVMAALSQARPEDVIITLDADNSHDPALAPKMAELISAGNDIVVASRYVDGAREIGLSAHRQIFSRTINWVLRKLSPIPNLRDYTCGYRAYRARLISDACVRYGSHLVEENGFTCMAELLLKLRPFIGKAAEVPLVLRYDLKRGKSKMKVTRTIFRYIRLVFLTLFWSKDARAR